MTSKQLKPLLKRVQMPARYSGGELNAARPKKTAALRFLMCFPDAYEVGHSNLGVKLLYGLLNRRPDTSAEFCFAPRLDMAAALKEADLKLFSIESKRAVKEFNIIGFSLQYELCYTNVLYMLDLAGIPLLASERNEADPIIFGGGPCCVNPYPIAPFFDLFCVGDGEDVINKVCGEYIKNKSNGGKKLDFLKACAGIEGVLVPSLKQKTVKRAVVLNLDSAYYPTDQTVPNIEAVHNRAALELFRGCTRGCRFCQAGMIYRPVRERKPDTLARYAKELIKNCGYDELSLSSLSTCDYPHLRELLTKIKPLTDKTRVSVSLPSTRADSFEAEFVEGARLSSLTFAPEAGTQRLRDVINKNVTEEDILSSCEAAFKRGYSSVKLYFMIGLPTETDADIDGIINLAFTIKKLYKTASAAKKPLALNVSTSTFIPKPFTPFCREAFAAPERVIKIQYYLKEKLKAFGVKYAYHDVKASMLECAFCRGGAELAPVLEAAYKSGCVFDGWGETFDFEKWTAAFNACGVDLKSYLKEIDINDTLPWDNIDVGVTKEFLENERRRGKEEKTTGDCRKGCNGCGINKHIGGKCP